MGSQDFRERSLAVLMVALMFTGLLPTALVLGAGGDGGGATPASWSGADDGHMWPMFARDASHGGEADAFARGITTPGVKWERTMTVQSLATVIGNFTGNVRVANASVRHDGELQLAVFTTANQVRMVRENGQDAWVMNITGTFSAAPALGDVDGDGRTDVVLATRTGVLYAYEPVIRWNGTRYTWWGNNTQREQLWNTTDDPIGTVVYSSLVLDDLNGDGRDELIVGSSQGVFCMNARSGAEIWNRSVSGVVISTPAVYRVGTARNVVATSWNATPAPDQLHVYTIRGTNGALIKRVSMELTFAPGTFIPTLPFFPSPVTADLDGSADGDELIILQPYSGSVGRIIVFVDGDLSWGSVAYNRSLGGPSDVFQIAHATPVVADLEGDGTLDVVVASWKTYQVPGTNTWTNVSVFRGIAGNRGWGSNLDVTGGIDVEWAMSSPVLMDVDEDGTKDVVLVQYNGRMHAVSGKNGTRLWDLTTRGYPASQLTTSPAVGDLDGDGFPEVIVNAQAVGFLLPDLEVTPEDITLTDPLPDEGDSVGIDVLVHNRGNIEARDVLVSVWDGDMLVGNATIDTIVSGSSYSARVQHQFYGRVGHTLRVEVDPLDEIEELRKDNNVATKDVTIVSRYGVALECPTNESFVNPGTTWHYFCEARNVGERANRIRVTSSPAPAGWTVTVTPSNFLLGPAGSPSDSTTVDVEVKVDPAAQAGPYPVRVTATSQNETRNNESVVLTTVVRGTHGVYLSPAEARRNVAPGDAVVYKFNATNIGNAVDSFSVEAVVPVPDPDWGVNVFPTQINGLAPEGQKEISVSVSAPYEATEGESFTVFVKVESLTEPTSYDESKTVTTVVIPDIAVLGLRYKRADGSEVDGTTKRLVVEEDSILVARLTNLRRNTDIGNLRVHFTVDGATSPVILKDMPRSGVTEVEFVHPFATLGVHSVQVVADPFEVISDADRSNNVANGLVTVKSRTPVGSYEVRGSVFLSDGVTPASAASVRLTVDRTGYSFVVTADGLGAYTASMADTIYQDGDLVTVNATDGRDHAEASLAVYSEDGGSTVDLVLSEGVHYDVELTVEQSQVYVATGAEGRFNLTVTALGTRDATVDLSVNAAGWAPRLQFPNGTTATVVGLPVGTSVDLVLLFQVSDTAEGHDAMTFHLLAVPRQDPTAGHGLNVTATVTPVVGFSIELVTSPPADAHPGESRMHNISVMSTGNVDDVVDLSFDTNFVTWNVEFDVQAVTLPAFGSVLVKVTLTVPTYVTAGDYDIAITGISRADDTVVGNVHIVEAVEDLRFGVSLVPTSKTASGKPGETVWWQLTVGNGGNVEDTYVISVFGLGQGWRYRFKEGAVAVTEMVLAPGQEKALVMEVDVPTEFASTPEKQVQITVKVGSLSEATAFNNTVLTLSLEGVLDLTIDVSTSTNSPQVGKRVVFTVTVTNLGPDDASGINVFLYLDDVREQRKTAGEVEAEGTKEVTIEWLPFEAGSVNVRIVVNPEDEDGTIWEMAYDNNAWVKPMKVTVSEDRALWEDPLLYVILVVLFILAGVVVVARGRSGGEGEAIEVVEVVEEGDGDEDLEEEGEEYDEDPGEEGEEYDEDLEEEEEYEDEENDLEEEEYGDGEEPAPARRRPPPKEGAEIPVYKMGRM